MKPHYLALFSTLMKQIFSLIEIFGNFCEEEDGTSFVRCVASSLSSKKQKKRVCDTLQQLLKGNRHCLFSSSIWTGGVLQKKMPYSCCLLAN